MSVSSLAPITGSSNIAAAGYDEQTRQLTIKFHHGRRYTYKEVPPEVFEQFMEADSKGAFFASSIKHNYNHD